MLTLWARVCVSQVSIVSKQLNASSSLLALQEERVSLGVSRTVFYRNLGISKTKVTSCWNSGLSKNFALTHCKCCQQLTNNVR